MTAPPDDLPVGLERGVAALLLRGQVERVLEEDPDRDPVRDLGRAAEVVRVEVSDHEVVDLPQAGHLGRHPQDPPRVAAFRPRGGRARAAGVDEHGLAGGRDDEGGGAALHVDPVDVEPPVLDSRLAGRAQGEGNDHQHEGALQAHLALLQSPACAAGSGMRLR
jgi:hypothetical protein